MSFNQREWVTDIVTGATTGMICGAAGAMLVPDPPFLDAMFVGGILGMVTGLIQLPIKWLLDCRPGRDERKEKP